MDIKGRKIHYIDVGNMTREEARKVVRDICTRYEIEQYEKSLLEATEEFKKFGISHQPKKEEHQYSSRWFNILFVLMFAVFLAFTCFGGTAEAETKKEEAKQEQVEPPKEVQKRAAISLLLVYLYFLNKK
jgi:hypothetical protein